MDEKTLQRNPDSDSQEVSTAKPASASERLRTRALFEISKLIDQIIFRPMRFSGISRSV